MAQVQTMKDDLTKLLLKWNDYLRLELSLNLSRGKPSKEQLDLSLPMMDVLSSNINIFSRKRFSEEKLLKVTIPEDLDYQDALNPILNKYLKTKRAKLHDHQII